MAAALAACTSEAPSGGRQAEGAGTGTAPASGSAASPTTPRTTTTPPRPRTPAPLPVAAQPPPDGACYRLTLEQATAPTTDADAVPCNGPHTAQTYHVGRLETVVDGHLLAVDSDLAQDQVKRTCQGRFARHVGGSVRDRRLARLAPVWFSPTIQQSDEGASWFRCDVVALGRAGRLAALPPPGQLRGILDRRDGLRLVGLCGTTAPGGSGFERVICASPHAWRAVSTIDIPSAESYPGVSAVRRAGEDECRDRVRRAAGSPARFRFGWEWPTRSQWAAGQRFGYCWAPR